MLDLYLCNEISPLSVVWGFGCWDAYSGHRRVVIHAASSYPRLLEVTMVFFDDLNISMKQAGLLGSGLEAVLSAFSLSGSSVPPQRKAAGSEPCQRSTAARRVYFVTCLGSSGRGQTGAGTARVRQWVSLLSHAVMLLHYLRLLQRTLQDEPSRRIMAHSRIF